MKNVKFKSVNLKKLNLLMMFLLLVTMMALFGACSKDKGGGGGITCPPGHVLVNNTCQYQGGNIGSGYSSIPSVQFIRNGSISYESGYRDFVYRYTFQYFNCWYSRPFRCNELQVSLRKINEENFILYIKSPMNAPQAGPSLYPNVIPVSVRKVQSPTHTGGFIFEAVYTNPYPYVALEIWVYGDMTQSTTQYTLYFEGDQIGSGSMRKGVDYL